MLGGLLAAAFGVIIGIPALRLKGDYLAIITLGFGEIIRVVSYNLEITNGAKALDGIKSLSSRQNPSPMFIYGYLTAAVIIVLLFTFGRSRHGRAVISIREDEIAAEAMGVNTVYYKLFAFVFAAFLAGIAGGLFAHNYGTIDPAKFDFNRSVEILIMVVLGGMGSITGSVISAGALTILSEKLREFSQYRMILYAVILILVMLFKPSGLMGRYEISIPGLMHRLVRKIRDRKKVAKTGEA